MMVMVLLMSLLPHHPPIRLNRYPEQADPAGDRRKAATPLWHRIGTATGQNYSGNGWKFENGTLILEPAAEKSYDFNGTDLNPHGVAVNCPVAVDSNTTITNGIFLKEVTGSALNGVFLNVPTGCENSAKKITVSDNGKITALKMSGDSYCAGQRRQ